MPTQPPTGTSPIIPGYITTAESMARSGLSRSQITLLCRRGEDNGGIRSVKLAPRLWLVETASLDQYMATEHKPGPKPKEPPAS